MLPGKGKAFHISNAQCTIKTTDCMNLSRFCQMFFHVFLFWPILIISCSKEFMDQCGWRRWAIDRNGSEVDLGDLRWGIDQLSAILYTISAIQYYGILCYRIQYQRSIQRCWCWSNCLFVFVLHVFVCLVGNEVDLRVAVCGEIWGGGASVSSLADTTCQFLFFFSF